MKFQSFLRHDEILMKISRSWLSMYFTGTDDSSIFHDKKCWENEKHWWTDSTSRDNAWGILLEWHDPNWQIRSHCSPEQPLEASKTHSVVRLSFYWTIEPIRTFDMSLSRFAASDKAIKRKHLHVLHFFERCSMPKSFLARLISRNREHGTGSLEKIFWINNQGFVIWQLEWTKISSSKISRSRIMQRLACMNSFSYYQIIHGFWSSFEGQENINISRQY